jgi:hypothetical protein
MQTILNLIYAMAARSLEAHAGHGMTGKYQAVSAVLHELQTSSTSPLWPSEALTCEAPHGSTFPVLKRLVLQVCNPFVSGSSVYVLHESSPL